MGSMPRRTLLLLAGSALLLAPLLTVQLATGAGRAHACVCIPTPPPLEALEGASAVLAGTVVSIGSWSVSDDGFIEILAVELDVHTVWKGPTTSTTFVYLHQRSSCMYPGFVPGEDFLVYAHTHEEALVVSHCSRTKPLERGEQDMRELGPGHAPEPGVTAAPRPAIHEQQTADPGETGTGPDSRDSLHSLAWWAPLLAGIAAAALIIRRWARHRELE